MDFFIFCHCPLTPKKADRATKGWFSRAPKLSDRNPRRVSSVPKSST